MQISSYAPPTRTVDDVLLGTRSRESVVEPYSSIVQGCSQGSKHECRLPRGRLDATDVRRGVRELVMTIPMAPVTSRFAGQTALVTGAGSGIGRAIALRLATEGARVFSLDISSDAAEETAALIHGAGGQATAIACDVGDTGSVSRVFEDLDRLNVLVNSAGIAHVGTVEQTTPEDLDRIYRVNAKGTFHSVHFGVPLIRRSGSGAILNLASFAAKIGIVDRFAYSMSKGAVLAMTLSIACDYVAHGIRCNCLCPTRVHTAFIDGFLETFHPTEKERVFEKLSAFQPIGRMGTPQEVAALAVFLCSPDAAFIIGAAYDIDGGAISLR
jgi:NAD(P)-dependent dehydrogenase (short-subunit alcohol dehydrogenase family)